MDYKFNTDMVCECGKVLYGGYHGGPAYYIHDFAETMRKKKLKRSIIAVLFAISGLICWGGISQVISNSVAGAFKISFGIKPLYTTLVLVVLAAFIVLRKKATVKVLDIIVPAGFDSVDYMLNDLVFDNSEMYLADTKEYCERVRREAESRGITVEQTHAPFQFKYKGDPEHLETVVIPRVARSLEMSALMGAKICVVHPLPI